jgi:hypothetical protein
LLTLLEASFGSRHSKIAEEGKGPSEVQGQRA